MTVRAWFTISAAALVLLFAAFLLRLFAPVAPPAISARSGTTRLQGSLEAACWPQPTGTLRCRRSSGSRDGRPFRVRPAASLRVVVEYPVQPKEGTIRVVSRSTGRTAARGRWTRTFHYELATGDYDVIAEARYPADAYVRYRFTFLRVTRSGS